jgi:hypothetical protein
MSIRQQRNFLIAQPIPNPKLGIVQNLAATNESST